MKDLRTTAESRQALRWLAQELAWERVLTGLRHDDDATTERTSSRAAA